jgi:hypothetical protein
MAVETIAPSEERWKEFLKNHWKLSLLILGGIVLAIIGALCVFLWRTTGPEATGYYPQTLDLWTVGYIITLILNLILWEFLVIGIPVIAAVIIIYFLWWNKLPAEEKQKYSRGREAKRIQKRNQARRGSGAFGFLVTITWLIIILIDGNWNTAFENWTYTYLIYSVLTAIMWDLIIFGIPIVILLILWLGRQLKK